MVAWLKLLGGQESEALRCSFCEKTQAAAGKLFSAPSDYPRAYICDECVTVCASILDKMPQLGVAGGWRLDSRNRRITRPPQSPVDATTAGGYRTLD